MLDELKELKLYTFDAGNVQRFPKEGAMVLPISKGAKRSRSYGFTCVPRALETIARHCLHCGGQQEPQARVDATIKALRDWCGFSGSQNDAAAIPGMEHCHRWMKRYLRSYCKLHPSLDVQVLTKAWNERKDAYEEGLFALRSMNASDINAVTYESVVARALRKGPLRRMCMVGKLAPNEACTMDDQKKDGTFKKVDVRNAPTILALTALCLMGLGCADGVPQTGFVPISLQDLRLWLGRNKEFDHGILKSWLYDGEPLFLQDSEEAGVRSWRVSQKWLDDGQWQLIDITEGEGALEEFCRCHAGEGFLCYRDAPYDEPGFELGPLKKLVSSRL